MADSQTTTGVRNRSEGTDPKLEAKRNRLEVKLAGARLQLATAVGERQRLFWYSKIAEIESEL